MKNYIFGYGSLIEKESRLRTTPKALNAFPAEIHGFVRGWWARTDVAGFSTTFLGCIEIVQNLKTSFSSNYVNGVIYEVNEDELDLSDLREAGYKRILLNHSTITDYSDTLEPGSNVWIYINDFLNETTLNESMPTHIFPIVQSYVDICINGCLEIEAAFPLARTNEFAARFIQSTQGWNNHWANDRIYPRRPFIYCPAAHQIDQLLKDHLVDKSIFDNIYIE